ncbi:(2Fe-2S)-binding protein, partial [Phenylobacterium sp.]|uniref:(2Fe-2S)-binding protein n=1 Tax=Phenylobacterium sp. TaxID=1871053 RepID=UPI002810B833
LSPLDRAALLVGRAPGRQVESGPIVCACRGVRAARIQAAVAAGAVSADDVASATDAGSSCGSCRPEIVRLIAAAKPEVRHAA